MKGFDFNSFWKQHKIWVIGIVGFFLFLYINGVNLFETDAPVVVQSVLSSGFGIGTISVGVILIGLVVALIFLFPGFLTTGVGFVLLMSLFVLGGGLVALPFMVEWLFGFVSTFTGFIIVASVILGLYFFRGNR